VKSASEKSLQTESFSFAGIGTRRNFLPRLPPGLSGSVDSCLDIGAGEGADALWPAEHDWQVTTNDISQRALERIAAEAQRRRLAP
jgi:2-polyprenyl-3-methyl-5-hydroxy-6-metoxy-1,4-benzoquinol methylase